MKGLALLGLPMGLPSLGLPKGLQRGFVKGLPSLGLPRAKVWSLPKSPPRIHPLRKSSFRFFFFTFISTNSQKTNKSEINISLKWQKV